MALCRFVVVLWLLIGIVIFPAQANEFQSFNQSLRSSISNDGKGPSSSFQVLAGQNASNQAQPLLDDLFAEVASRVPEFGGMFLDGNVLMVYLTNPGLKIASENAIVAVFGRDRIPQGGVQVLQGEYRFAELRSWHEKLGNLFRIQGLVFTDTDERENRVKVGVVNSDLIATVRQEAIGLGVPADALLVVETAPIVVQVSLRDRIRPVRGGTQIQFTAGTCTLGFNAIRSGVQGFLTNSHCTVTQGGVEGTAFYQPTVSAENLVGTETADPLWRGYQCSLAQRLLGYVCRYSDSAFAQLQSGVSASLGVIARPDSVNTNSLTIAGTFQVVSEGSSFVGHTLNKVGRTTGWTQGSVTGTCMDFIQAYTNRIARCQDEVRATSSFGDSGSPVFSITNSAQNDVQLRGIMWGGDGTSFVYSPIANIERADELGGLTSTQNPDFEISAGPSSLPFIKPASGSSSQTSTIEVTSIGGWVWQVDLKASWVLINPGDASYSFNPSSVTPPSNGAAQSILTVTIGANSYVGTYTLRVEGTSGAIARTVDVAVIINPSTTYPLHVDSKEDTGSTEHNPGGLIRIYPTSSCSGIAQWVILPPGDTQIAAGSYCIRYFYDPGYSFVRWESSGGVTVGTPIGDAFGSAVMTVTSSGSLTLIYHFTPGGGDMASTSLTIVPSPNPVAPGSQVTFTVNLGGSWHELIGVVSSKQIAVTPIWGGTGSCTTNSKGTCQVTLTAPLATGSYQVTGQFSGDADFNPTQGSTTLSVQTLGPPHITATITNNGGTALFTLKVSTTANVGVCTKSMYIMTGQTGVLDCTVNPGTYIVRVIRATYYTIYGPVTVTVPPDYTITLTYPSASASLESFGLAPASSPLGIHLGQNLGPVTHSRASTGIDIVAVPNPVGPGGQVTFTITLYGTWHELSGVVSSKLITVSAQWGGSGTCTTSSLGKCQVISITPSSTGSYVVTAQFSGDENFDPSQSSIILSVQTLGPPHITATITNNGGTALFTLKVSTTANVGVCTKSMYIMTGQTGVLDCTVSPGTYIVRVIRATYYTIYGPTTVTLPPDAKITIKYP